MTGGERDMQQEVRDFLARRKSADEASAEAAYGQEAREKDLVLSSRYDSTWVDPGSVDDPLPLRFWFPMPEEGSGEIVLTEFSLEFPIEDRESLVAFLDSLRVLSGGLELAMLHSDPTFRYNQEAFGIDLVHEHLRQGERLC